MRYKSEDTVTVEAPAQKHSRIVKQTSVSALEVDFNIFGAREIRDVLKSKAHCLHAGFSPNHIIIKTLNEIRANYIRKVGLPTYLSQMLGELGTVHTRYCTLYGEDNHRIELHLNGHHNQPIQRFIAKRFHWNGLPFKVEVRRESDPARIDVRFL